MTTDSDTDSRAWVGRFWLALLVGSVAFGLGLGAVAWSLRSLAERYAPAGNERLHHLTRHADDYDVVVIGSSMIGVGFREEPFEERLRDEHGRRLRAYGFGMGGLHGAELDFYVHRILSLPGSKLRWLLIDVTVDQEPRMSEENWYSQRELDWQTPRQFAIVQSHVMAREQPLATRLRTLWPFARHLALNVLNVGRALPALEGFDRRNEPKDVAPVVDEEAGNLRLERKEAKAEKYRRRPQAHESAVRKLIEKRRRPPTRGNALPATWRDAAAARGVEVAFIAGPATRYAAFPSEVPGNPDLRVFDFNDPKKYPELYEISNRYDRIHLTEPGARLFSRELADALDAAMDDVEPR